MGTKYIIDNRPYVLWRRVSTKEQGKSGLGLEAQQEIAEYFTEKAPVKVFTDVYTGTKLNDCVQLWSAIDYCKENGYLLIIAKTDRFRNVIEALTVLDKVGEGNLVFCDMPTTDRFALTVAFAMWERQAIMGRINTRLALRQRKKALEADGHFISKSGNVCTHLGAEKGADMTAAQTAASELRMQQKKDWKESSPAYQRVKKLVLKGKSTREILEDFLEHAEVEPEVYCTRTGSEMTLKTLCVWKREILEDLRVEAMA